jgi:prophage tail gpP-like protein
MKGIKKMKCNTIKLNKECAFMKKNGCSFEGGQCWPVLDKCGGCDNIMIFGDVKYCKSYPNPNQIWIMLCPRATHVVAARLKAIKAPQKINPLKASKRLKKKATK